MATVVHSALLQARCTPEIVNRVDKAAAFKFMKPAEYIRRAVIDRLAADGMLERPAEPSRA
jgi:hypothetical protein